VSLRSDQIEELVEQGTTELLARAVDARSLSASAMTTHIRRAVEKYLLRDDEDASADSISSFINALQADDLCLVVACELGDQTAWDDLVERFSVTVRSAARSATSNEDAAEDLAQSIWAELHGLKRKEDGVPAGKLAYYSGRGSLAGWLRAVVAQLAVDQHRKQARLVQTEEDSDFDRMSRDSESRDSKVSSDTLDPEQAVAEKFAARDLQAALAEAIEGLSQEDRLLVKLYYFDDLRLREAGAVLGVHEATASRRLTRIQRDLRDGVQRALVEQHGWTKAEAEQSFAEVAQEMDIELESLVTPSAALNERAPGA